MVENLTSHLLSEYVTCASVISSCACDISQSFHFGHDGLGSVTITT